MWIEVFSLCDAATADVGKLNVLGAFDTIWANKLPIVLPSCAVALRTRFSFDEKGEHEVSVKFVDMDGNHILPPASGKLNVDFSTGQTSVSANLILTIQRLKIEKCGEYSIDLIVDGVNQAHVPLFVNQRQTIAH